MVVVTLEKCPLALRGDLTKWLQEISPGVYVGNVSARVREKLWERVCEEARGGRVTMVFSAQNEQRYDFRVHNALWEPIDYDGIKLMLRPSAERLRGRSSQRLGPSRPIWRGPHSARRRERAPKEPHDYVVVDVETTGLDPSRDTIIEVGALKVTDGEVTAELSRVIAAGVVVPDDIVKLTGLSQSEVDGGVSAEEAMDDFLDFIENDPLVMHNAEFDVAFLDALLEELEYGGLGNELVDTLALARKWMPNARRHSLESLAELFGIDGAGAHRALSDCAVTREVFVCLLERGAGQAART